MSLEGVRELLIGKGVRVRWRNDFPNGQSGGIAPLILGFVGVALLVVIFIGYAFVHLVHGVSAGPAASVPARLSVQLTSVDGGTDVRLALAAADRSHPWPRTLRLSFARRDSGNDSSGPALTDQPLMYSAIQAGSGADVQAGSGSPGFAVSLPTDGEAATLSFRVAAVNGVRAVWPVPVAAGLDITSITAVSTSGTPTCQRPEKEVGLGYPDYVSCQVTGSGAVLDTDGSPLPADGVRNSVRLVLP